MRNAFSMLELVFVIVILGILAAIAIPKFSFTRGEAQAVSIQADITQALSAIQREAFVKNPPSSTINGDWILQNAGLSKTRWIAVGNGVKLAKNGAVDSENDCVTFEFVNQNEILVEITSKPSSSLCSKLLESIESKRYPLIAN